MMESSAGRKGNEVNISENGRTDKRFGGMSVWFGMSIKQRPKHNGFRFYPRINICDFDGWRWDLNYVAL